MTERNPLPSPVDLQPELIRAGDGTGDTLYAPAGAAQGFVPGPPIRHNTGGHVPGAAVPPAPDLPGERTLPAPGPGIIFMRLGDIRNGVLIVDSTTRQVMGRVIRWNLGGSKIGGKSQRRRITIELEEDAAP